MFDKTFMNYQELGIRVRQQREEMNWTQKDLANCTGVTASSIGHIERAEKIPSLETVARRCIALDTTMEWLVFGERQKCEGDACPLFAGLEALFSAYGFGRKA